MLENVRVAWQWAIHAHAWPLLDDAFISLIGYYLSEGLINEAIELLGQLAAHLHPSATGSIEARLLGRALAYQAALVGRRDLRADTALELARAAVEWAQLSEDPVTQSFAAYAFGSVLALAASLALLPPGD